MATSPKSNPGHVGGRRVQLPLRHPRSPSCDVSVHGRLKGDLKPNVFVTLVGEANGFAFETLVRSTGRHLKFLVLKSLSFDVQEQKSLNISKNGNSQQHTYRAYSMEKFTAGRVNSTTNFTRKTDIARIAKRWVRYRFFAWNLTWNPLVRQWIFLESHS